MEIQECVRQCKKELGGLLDAANCAKKVAARSGEDELGMSRIS